MVTTRRSSFGTQDGDALALRSRSIPASLEPTPSRKRKEDSSGARPPAPKKPKSFTNDGTGDVGGGHMHEIALESSRNGSTWVEPASGEGKEGETHLGSGIPNVEKSTLDHHAADKAEQPMSPNHSLVDGTNQHLMGRTVDDMTSAESTDHQSRDVSQNTNKIDDEKLAAPTSIPNVHKRFGSEEPMVEREDDAGAEPRRDEQEAGSANANAEEHESDDDVPEIVGSKSMPKAVRPPVKVAKKSKKAKRDTALNEPPVNVAVKLPSAADDAFLVDPSPQPTRSEKLDLSRGIMEPFRLSTKADDIQQPPKKRKVFDASQKTPKDVIEEDVTYRTLSDPHPIAFDSKRQRTSHLPPKSNTSIGRLRKQVFGRKKVQYVWGGRSMFLRS